MTDRSAAPEPARRRRLGRRARLAVAGTFAALLLMVWSSAWLQIAVLSGLPSRAQLQGLGAVAPASARGAAGTDPRLADETAGLLLSGPTPALKRDVQRRLLAMRLRGALTPDEISRIYASAEDAAQATGAPAPPDPRPAFYRALAGDFDMTARGAEAAR